MDSLPMGIKSKKRHIYCFVPKCYANATKNPDKHFFTLPENPRRRKNWLLAARKTNYAHSEKSKLRICEDHFNFETDLKNFHEHRLTRSKPYLKEDAVPSRFECQGRHESTVDRHLSIARSRRQLVADLISGDADYSSQNMDTKAATEISPVKQEVKCNERVQEPLPEKAYGEINYVSHGIKIDKFERNSDAYQTEEESFGHSSKGTDEVCFNHVPMMKSEHLCRICVKESNFYKHIFWQYVLDKRLFEIINELCQMDICYDDGLPEYICLECYNKVLEFHKFKESCHKGKETLLSMTPTYLKVVLKEGGNDVNLIEQLPVKKCFTQVASQNEWESPNCPSAGGKTFCENLQESEGLSQGNESDSSSRGADSECDREDQMEIDDFGLSHLKTEPPDEIEENVPCEVQPIKQHHAAEPYEELMFPLLCDDNQPVVYVAQSSEEVSQDSSAIPVENSSSTLRKPRQRKQALTERNWKGVDFQFEKVGSKGEKFLIVESSSDDDSVIYSVEPPKEKERYYHEGNQWVSRLRTRT